MSLTRWLATFLAFPIGGYLAIETVGSLDGPFSAAMGGLLVGAVIGVAQWLALRSHGIGARWIALTAVALAVGSAIAALATDAGTSVGALVVTGLVNGLVVGAAQAPVLTGDRRAQTAWTALMSLIWGVGWLISANVLVDEDRGYYSFGASGALVVALVTGLALRRIFADRASTDVVESPHVGARR